MFTYLILKDNKMFYIKGIHPESDYEWYVTDKDISELECKKEDATTFKTHNEAIEHIPTLPIIDNGNGHYIIIEE
jgi:hypothetical protein